MVGGIQNLPLTSRFGFVFNVLCFPISCPFFPPGLPETGSGTPGNKIHQVSSKSVFLTPSYLLNNLRGECFLPPIV